MTWLIIPRHFNGGIFFFLLNVNHKRILGANYQFDDIPPRPLGPLGDLIWQVIKRCSVREREEEKNSIHLLLTRLEKKTLFFLQVNQGSMTCLSVAECFFF